MINIESVTKRYDNSTIIKSVSLSCNREELLAVAGSSGSGKTTLLRLIAGLEKVDEGSITIDKRIVSNCNIHTEPYSRNISLVFQNLALWPHFTASDHIAFVLKGKHNDQHNVREKIDLILHEVGLTGFDKRYPHQLSGGEQQRLAIARALAGDPDYLLLDEPFSHLDPILAENLLRLIVELKNKNRIGVIFVIHDSSDVLALADKIAIMQNGRLLKWGTRREIAQSTDNDYTRKLLRLDHEEQ